MPDTFDWFDNYEYNEGNTQRILDPGIYDFTVSTIEKTWWEGSTKIPPCNALNMWMNIDGEDVTLFEKFFLYSSMLWKIDRFLKSIGFEEQRIPLLLQATGKSGMCHVCTKIIENGQIINNIDRFITDQDDQEWLRLRDIVLNRDGYKCTVCGSEDGLRIHHVIEKSADSLNKYNPNNLITLCEACHQKAHARHLGYRGVGFF